MFPKLRKRIKLIMWILIISFISWGGGTAITSRHRNMPKYAGRIFGKKISFEEYNKSYIAVRNQAVMVYGEKFFEIEPYLNLEQDAWDYLILLYEAKRRKIRIDDKALQENIKDMPVFKKDGSFNFSLYSYIIENFYHMEPKEFEEQMRKSFIISKLKDSITQAVDTNEDELWLAYKRQNEKLKVSYILIEVDKYKDRIKTTEEILNKFYQENKQGFQRPQQANIEYIKVSTSSFEKETKITDAEISEYFRKHKDEFKSKDAVAPQEISKEMKNQITDKLMAEKSSGLAEELIYKVYSEVKENKDLEGIAKKYNLTTKESGLFSQAPVIPRIGYSVEISKYAFELDIGQISRPMQVKNDFFIIKIKERKPPYMPQLDEIKEEVRRNFIKKEAEALASKDAQDILLEIKNSSFEKVVKDKNLSINETIEFGMSEYLEDLGPANRLFEEAFGLNLGDVGPVVEILPKGFIIFRLVERKPASPEEYKKAEETFKEGYTLNKKQKEFAEWFKNLKESARLESNIEKLKKTN